MQDSSYFHSCVYYTMIAIKVTISKCFFHSHLILVSNLIGTCIFRWDDSTRANKVGDISRHLFCAGIIYMRGCAWDKYFFTLVIYFVWLLISSGSSKAAHQYVVSFSGMVTYKENSKIFIVQLSIITSICCMLIHQKNIYYRKEGWLYAHC